MKRFGWILFAVLLTGFEFWAVFTPSGPMNFATDPILLPSILGAFATSGIGGWWMLYMIVRRERRVFPLILVPLLIPNSFLWYCFERLPAKIREQSVT